MGIKTHLISIYTGIKTGLSWNMGMEKHDNEKCRKGDTIITSLKYKNGNTGYLEI